VQQQRDVSGWYGEVFVMGLPIQVLDCGKKGSEQFAVGVVVAVLGAVVVDCENVAVVVAVVVVVAAAAVVVVVAAAVVVVAAAVVVVAAAVVVE
jgi:hypothetical protein